MLQALEEARAEPDTDTAKDRVDDALDIVRSRRAISGALEPTPRIEIFVDWLEDLRFQDSVTTCRSPSEGPLRALKLAAARPSTFSVIDRVKEITGSRSERVVLT